MGNGRPRIKAPHPFCNLTSCFCYDFPLSVLSLLCFVIYMSYLFFPGKWITRASLAFIIGTILFAGSIYLMTYLEAGLNIQPGLIGILTPLGGLFLILGWLCLLIGINVSVRNKRKSNTVHN